MNTGEVHALIQLLDDPDEEVYSQIRSKILSLGNDVIPFLEGAWETTFDASVQSRIETLIHTIQFGKLIADLTNWKHGGGIDLMEGVILIARYQYPDVDANKIEAQIEQLRQDVWLEITPMLTPLEKVKVINHILFDIHGFSGNTSNYHAPQNSFINTVLESKKGNPLSLAIVYSLVAQSLNIPVFGVNLPEHFILAYVENAPNIQTLIADKEPTVLFYINAFSKGSVFSRLEINRFLQQLKLEHQSTYYSPCTNIEIIKRQLRNLEFSYEKTGYPDKRKEIKKLINIFTT